MISFLISRKSFLFLIVFKKKAKKPKSSASFPRNHSRHIRLPSSIWHYICKAAISDSPNTPCARQQVITRIRQSSSGNALPALSLQQATGVLWKFNAGLQAHSSLCSYQEITRWYALHVYITPHHPQLRAAFLSWRTHLNPSVSKHYPTESAPRDRNFAFT